MNQADKLKQLQEDMKADWWKAGPVDGFDLQKKLDRVGCRPIRRKFLSCKTEEDSMELYADCKVRLLLR